MHIKWTDKLSIAKSFATEAHKGQTRKNGEPYINHPETVAALLATYFEPEEDYVVAAWLHDVVEDCDITADQIKRLFGDKIAEIVIFLTKESGQSKKDYYSKLADAPTPVKQVKLCDRLANLSDTLKLDLSDPDNLDFAKYYIRDTMNLLDRLDYRNDTTYLMSNIADMVDSVFRASYGISYRIGR